MVLTLVTALICPGAVISIFYFIFLCWKNVFFDDFQAFIYKRNCFHKGHLALFCCL